MNYFKIMYVDDWGTHESIIGASNEQQALEYLKEENNDYEYEVKNIMELQGEGVIVSKIIKPNGQQMFLVKKAIWDEVYFAANRVFKRWEFEAYGVDVNEHIRSGHLVPYNVEDNE